MTTTVVTNRIKFPPGYAKLGGQVSPYKPWNGFISGYNSPAVVQNGATYTFTVASVPADLSHLTFIGPDGKSYDFQFVYNASVQTGGIKVPLPNSGSSTAAQVATALFTVMNAQSSLDFTGKTVVFPWKMVLTGPAIVQTNWTIVGDGNASGSVPAGITEAIAQGGISISAAVTPAQTGFVGAFLPGV